MNIFIWLIHANRYQNVPTFYLIKLKQKSRLEINLGQFMLALAVYSEVDIKSIILKPIRVYSLSPMHDRNVYWMQILISLINRCEVEREGDLPPPTNFGPKEKKVRLSKQIRRAKIEKKGWRKRKVWKKCAWCIIYISIRY